MIFCKETAFIQTSIGLIPNDWGVAKIGDIAEINKESRDPSMESPDDTFQYVDIESVTGGSGRIKNTKKMLGKEAPSRARRVIHENDVLMSTVRPYLKAFTMVPKWYDNEICSTGFAVLTCKENINPQYLLHTLFSDNVIAQCNRMVVGGLYPALNSSQVAEIKLPVPPLPEQRAIVGVLGVVDCAIELADRIVAQTERLKRGLMQQLLTRGIGHTETKQTPIGELPANWEVTEIGNLGELQYGYTASTVKENTGVKFLRITDIEENGCIGWGKVPYCNIPKQDINKYSLKKGDILFARIGATAGKTALVEENVCGVFASYLIRLKTNDTIHPQFAFYFTQSEGYWSQALRQREGQLKKGINATMLSKFAIPLPPLEEQKKIAEILSVTDHKLSLEREERKRVENIKRGLMDLLLTGKVRIKVD